MRDSLEQLFLSFFLTFYFYFLNFLFLISLDTEQQETNREFYFILVILHICSLYI